MINQSNITNNPFTAASGSASQASAAGQQTASNAQNRLENAQNSVNKISQEQKEKLDNYKKILEDKKNTLNIDPGTAKATIVGIVLPLLTKFINTEKAANVIINKLIRTTKKRLKDKGRVEVNNGIVTFYPKNPGDYSNYKRDFYNKVDKLKRIVKIIKTIIDSIIVVLKTSKIILAALKVQLQLKQKKLAVTAVAASADLSGPSSSKPAAAKYPVDKELNDQVTKELEDKINNYILMITVIQTILQLFQKMINALKAKVELLSFTINQNPVSQANLSVGDIDSDFSIPTDYNDGTRNYKIEVITTPAGFLQAVAYDAFSGLKITQTAPSKTRKADELIEELKLILG
jgi:hypothetical protein